MKRGGGFSILQQQMESQCLNVRWHWLLCTQHLTHLGKASRLALFLRQLPSSVLSFGIIEWFAIIIVEGSLSLYNFQSRILYFPSRYFGDEVPLWISGSIKGTHANGCEFWLWLSSLCVSASLCLSVSVSATLWRRNCTQCIENLTFATLWGRTTCSCNSNGLINIPSHK